MTTRWIESLTGSLEQKKQYRQYKGRIEALPEPYRTTVILRDLEEMSYEEIAEITDVSLGTVKSRLTRGREALRRRLTGYVMEHGEQLGLQAPQEVKQRQAGCVISAIEVTR